MYIKTNQDTFITVHKKDTVKPETGINYRTFDSITELEASQYITPFLAFDKEEKQYLCFTNYKNPEIKLISAKASLLTALEKAREMQIAQEMLVNKVCLFDAENDLIEINYFGQQEIELYQVLINEIEMVLKSYEINYNKQNTDNIKLILKLHKHRATDKFVDKVALMLEIVENGVRRSLDTKTMNFTHKRQLEDKNYWQTKLYREILYQLVGTAIMYCQMKEKAKKGLL